MGCLHGLPCLLAVWDSLLTFLGTQAASSEVPYIVGLQSELPDGTEFHRTLMEKQRNSLILEPGIKYIRRQLN